VCKDLKATLKKGGGNSTLGWGWRDGDGNRRFRGCGAQLKELRDQLSLADSRAAAVRVGGRIVFWERGEGLWARSFFRRLGLSSGNVFRCGTEALFSSLTRQCRCSGEYFGGKSTRRGNSGCQGGAVGERSAMGLVDSERRFEEGMGGGGLICGRTGSGEGYVGPGSEGVHSAFWRM